MKDDKQSTNSSTQVIIGYILLLCIVLLVDPGFASLGAAIPDQHLGVLSAGDREISPQFVEFLRRRLMLCFFQNIKYDAVSAGVRRVRQGEAGVLRRGIGAQL